MGNASALYGYINSDGPNMDWKVLARASGQEGRGEGSKKVAAITAFRNNTRFFSKPDLYECKCLIEEYARRFKAGELVEGGITVQRVVLGDNASLILTKEGGLTTIAYSRIEAEQLNDNEVAQALVNVVLAYNNR